MDIFQSLQQFELWGNTTVDYLLAIITVLGGVLVTQLLKTLILKRIERWSHQTATELDDRLIRIIKRPLLSVVYVGIAYIAIHNLNLHPILEQTVQVLGVILATVLIIQLTGSLVEYGFRVYGYSHRDNPGLQQTFNTLIPAVKILIWAVGLIFLLDNLGFDISAVVAGLGIGGVAVALASQGVLQDLFSYFAIIFDRPFELADFIMVDDLVGTVEQIGIKTTHLRSLSGEQLIMANSDLINARIRNFKRMQRRRIAFSLGITYETGLAKIQQIPAIIQRIVDNTPNTTFDRAHFLSYGDFSLDFEVVYFVETDNYAAYMNAQHQINLDLKAAFEDQGIEFAYPTQVLYLNSQNNVQHNMSTSTVSAMADAETQPTRGAGLLHNGH
jgi:small-conductance mechanosensitive channel